MFTDAENAEYEAIKDDLEAAIFEWRPDLSEYEFPNDDQLEYMQETSERDSSIPPADFIRSVINLECIRQFIAGVGNMPNLSNVISGSWNPNTKCFVIIYDLPTDKTGNHLYTFGPDEQDLKKFYAAVGRVHSDGRIYAEDIVQAMTHTYNSVKKKAEDEGTWTDGRV